MSPHLPLHCQLVFGQLSGACSLLVLCGLHSSSLNRSGGKAAEVQKQEASQSRSHGQSVLHTTKAR